jgi:hypothetical protein
MANNIAFQPMGKTFKLTANTSVQTIQVTSDSPTNQYLFINHENPTGQPVYVRISDQSGQDAAIPGNGTANAAYGIPVRPSSYLIMTGPQCSSTKIAYISVTAEGDSPEIYIVPGEGML